MAMTTYILALGAIVLSSIALALQLIHNILFTIDIHKETLASNSYIIDSVLLPSIVRREECMYPEF